MFPLLSACEGLLENAKSADMYIHSGPAGDGCNLPIRSDSLSNLVSSSSENNDLTDMRLLDELNDVNNALGCLGLSKLPQRLVQSGAQVEKTIQDMGNIIRKKLGLKNQISRMTKLFVS